MLRQSFFGTMFPAEVSVAWFLGQSLVFLVLAFALGLLVGWLLWGRRTTPSRSSRDPFARSRPAAPAAGRSRHAAESEDAGPAVATPAEPAAEAAPEPAPEPVAVAEPVAEAEPEPGSASAIDADTETVPVAESAPESEAVSAAEVEPGAGSVPVPAPAPAPESESAPAAEPVAVAEPEPVAAAMTSDPEPEPLAPKVVARQLFLDAEVAPGADPLDPATGGGRAQDHLRRIEGIGPKISSVLADAGITTFAQLAELDRISLTEILTAGGVKFAPSLSTWSEQARLLADGDEAAFTELTSQLVAGRRGR